MTDENFFGVFELQALPVPLVDVVDISWLIDVGAFFDRFGATKMAVLASSNTTVKALVSDCMCRKWIDLKRADLPAAIDLIIAAGIPGVNTALKNIIINTPVTAAEQLALKKLYFS